MAFAGTGKIWMNGKLVEWKDANIHIASHVIHYGSGVFEGARVYDTPEGPAILRLDAHMARLVASAKICRMECPYTQDQLEKAVIDTDFPEEDKFAHLPAAKKEVTIKRGLTAFLTVQEGCDKFCSFCVVPYTRGAEQSRPPAAILREARQLVDKGARELVLLGQNVNAYASEDWSLARLCDELAKIEDLARIQNIVGIKYFLDLLHQSHLRLIKDNIHIFFLYQSDTVLTAQRAAGLGT